MEFSFPKSRNFIQTQHIMTAFFVNKFLQKVHTFVTFYGKPESTIRDVLSKEHSNAFDQFESEEIMMKKLFALLMALSLVMASGCASKEDTAPADDPNNGAAVEEPQDAQNQENADADADADAADADADADADAADADADAEAEEKTCTGTLGEVKDFMFEVTDDQGTSYAFTFEGEQPEGLADAKTGDKVTVTYTGELSEVDAFQGTVISVALAE